MIRKLHCLPLALCLMCVAARAQAPATLEPAKVVEREIVGGESHLYQISLTAGQFVRFRLAQHALDVLLLLSAPDGKPLAERNLTGLTRLGEQESLSLEAPVTGGYRLTVRGAEAAVLRGSYRLEATVRAEATVQDRQRLQAEALLVEANELSQQAGRTAQQVSEKAQQALPLWRELGEPHWAAYALSLIGAAYFDLSQYGKATEQFEQALALWREVKDRAGEGHALNYLGGASSNLSRPEKAIEYYEQALAIWRELRYRRTEGAALNNLGRIYDKPSRHEKAIEYYDQALTIYREVKDRAREGGMLYSLGRAYQLLGRNEKAIEYSEQALQIYREVKDRVGEGNALNVLGLSHGAMGRPEKAIGYYEQSLQIAREVKNRQGEGIALANLSRASNRLGHTEKTIEYYEQALAIHREVKDQENERVTLIGLGIIYRDLARTEKAIECFEQARALAREMKSRAAETLALHNLGVVYTVLSRYERAIEYYEQALAIRREVKDRQGEAATLTNLGRAYVWLGRTEKAIEYHEQALAAYREVKDRTGEGGTLDNLGNAYSARGDHEKAIGYYEQSLAIAREIKNRALEGAALIDLGKAYSSLGRAEKAVEYLEQALATSREIKRRFDEGDTLRNLGEAYRLLGRLDEAVRHHEQALLVARELKAQTREADVLSQLARDERQRGNLARARTHVEESLAIAESLRSDEIASPESRAGFLATVQGSYQLYTDLLMRQHQAEPTKGFDALAVEVSERQRARSLLDLLAEARADVRQGVDPALLERERSLGRQLNNKAQRLTQANRPEQAEALKKEISQLETDYERAQAAIRKAYPHYAALVQPQPLKLKEIQAQLDPNTLLLEYALGAERSYLWAIAKDALASYELPKQEVIGQSARQVYDLLQARSTVKRRETVAQQRQRIAQADTQLTSAAQALSQLVLAPVAAQLGNKRLVIVADGALQYVPFAMLVDPVVGKHQPLIVSHEVVSLPSASALAIQRAELADRQPAPKLLAVIADPVFDRSDERFKAPAAEASDKQPAQTSAFNDTRSIEQLAEKPGDKAGVTTRRLVIPRLPFTRQEATRLLALTPKESNLSALDFQANRATVLNGDLGQYRYVHFATHGLLDTERPGLSSLVLSMVDGQGKPQDGFLRANDIYNLKLPAELVVLSACQTGLGKEIKGEGLVSLTRGFMYAGAARVVVSLWSVNDKATADLMTKFYQKMLKEGERPAAALRAAQVETWKQKQWQAPYYWAAFTLQGEWK